MADASEDAPELESPSGVLQDDNDDGILVPKAPDSRKVKRMRPRDDPEATLNTPPNASAAIIYLCLLSAGSQ